MEAAGHGYLAVDHRLLHAILDRPERSIPDLARFSSENPSASPVELDGVLLDLFRALRTQAAVPFLIQLVRRNPREVSDEIIETLAPLGSAAVNPLLELLAEIESKGDDPAEILFALTQLRVVDPRILDALTRNAQAGNADAALFLEMYQEPANPEEPDDDSFDIWEYYPEQDLPPLDLLSSEERLAMLDAPSAELRAGAAASFRNTDLDVQTQARLLQLVKNDSDPRVRGEGWESLEDLNREPEVRRAMLAVLESGETSIEEKAGVAAALAQQSDNPVVFQAIEALYGDPRRRAKALKAMGRSFDKRFAAYPPRHLDDPDSDIKRQAIWAIGYLRLSSEAQRLRVFFDDDEFREDALFAYALSVRAEISRGHLRSLLKKIGEAAGGLSEEEEELVKIAIDQRLVLNGKKPFFSAG